MSEDSGGEDRDAAGGERHAREEFRAQVQARKADIERQFEAGRAQYERVEEKIQARTGRNLILAVLIGVVFGGALLLSLILVKEIFMGLAALVAGFATFELVQAMRHGGYRVPAIPTVVAAVAVVPVSYYFGPSGQLVGILLGILLVSLWRLAEQLVPKRRTGGRALAGDLAGGAFVQGYVTLLASFAVLLTAAPDGEWWTLAFIITAVATDTGAYALGLLIGRHPMAPVISPKKTWEGFAGGAAAALLAGVLLSIFMLGNSWWFGLIFGVAILITATLGDLSESLIKRDLGIKDMSSWLPGHGGFLDRLDSILPSAAVAYLLYVFFA